MENQNEFELIISQGSRRWYERLLAIFLFSCAAFFIYRLGCLFFEHEANEDLFRHAAHELKPIAICFSGGIAFSMTKTILIDVDKNKLISRYEVGRFWRDHVSSIPALDYVSVFKNTKDQFETNLWYARNKHYKMFFFSEKAPALAFATMVAKKLNLELLDATEKGNNKWIEIEA